MSNPEFPTAHTTRQKSQASFGADDVGPPVVFDVGGEQFFASPVPPGGLVLDMAALADASEAEKFGVVSTFLDAVLYPESATRMAARMRSAERPISIATLSELTKWLMEEKYAMRPTVQPSPSPTSSVAPATAGNASTAGAPPVGWTPPV